MKIPLREAGAKVRRIEAQLGARLEREYPLPSFARVAKKTRDAARRFWSQRAWSEYAAVPALANILVKGVGDRVPVDESAALTGILHDEALHTQLSQQCADALGGYIEDVPDDLAFDPYAYATPSQLSWVGDLVMGACLGETVSRALIQARVPYVADDELRAIVMRTLKDESVHVAFAWAVAERAIPALSAKERREIAELVEPAARAAQKGTAGRGLTSSTRASQAKLKDLVAAAGLGSCPFDEERKVVQTLFTSTILPRLRRLQVPV